MQNTLCFFNNLNKSILSLLRIFLFSKSVKDFKKLKVEDQKLIILGNSPELINTINNNKQLLSDNTLMCVNYFAGSANFEELKPIFYVIIDRFVFSDSYDKEVRDRNAGLFKKIAETTTWDMTLFMPHEAKKHQTWQQIIKPNANIRIIYINLTPVEGFKRLSHKLYNRNFGMPRPHNVIIPAIYIALKINIKEIFLIGTDHSWLRDIYVNEDNTVMIEDKHFYDNNGRHRQFFYNTEKGKKPVKYHEALFTFMIAFKSYYKLKDYAIQKNAKIINCSKKSFIDAFVKDDLKSALNK